MPGFWHWHTQPSSQGLLSVTQGLYPALSMWPAHTNVRPSQCDLHTQMSSPTTVTGAHKCQALSMWPANTNTYTTHSVLQVSHAMWQNHCYVVDRKCKVKNKIGSLPAAYQQRGFVGKVAHYNVIFKQGTSSYNRTEKHAWNARHLRSTKSSPYISIPFFRRCRFTQWCSFFFAAPSGRVI